MIGKYPYDDINQVMSLIRDQIIDSLKYASYNCPKFRTPENLYKWLKRRVTYIKDPVGIELLQTMQTLFDANRHGIPGAGDCDCFTITAIACMKVQGWSRCRIYLAGRTRKVPVHIYAGVKFKGKELIFDLTNDKINEERKYPYRQKLIL